MVLQKGKTKNNIDIVLWDFNYEESHYYSVMAYPVAEVTDKQNSWGASRGAPFCLEINFGTLEEARRNFQELEIGKKTIPDLKDYFRNPADLEFI